MILEHDLGVTVEQDLKSTDDRILSSLVFVCKCIKEIRIMLETHYFFFVDQSQSTNTENPNDTLSNNQSNDNVSGPSSEIFNISQEEDDDDDDDNIEEQRDSNLNILSTHSCETSNNKTDQTGSQVTNKF